MNGALTCDLPRRFGLSEDSREPERAEEKVAPSGAGADPTAPLYTGARAPGGPFGLQQTPSKLAVYTVDASAPSAQVRFALVLSGHAASLTPY
jgi:hypothetical protein